MINYLVKKYIDDYDDYKIKEYDKLMELYVPFCRLYAILF